MIKATYDHKNLVIEILSKAFDANQSVNFIVQQDSDRAKRIKALMAYSFEVCHTYGEVYLSDDLKACALILFPDKKKTSLKSIILDIELIISCIGFANLKKATSRESKIKKLQPNEKMYYLWFIGVDPQYQNGGTGTKLLMELIEESHLLKRPMYLETSTLKNLPWYQKLGFTIYNELDLGYKLFFLRKMYN